MDKNHNWNLNSPIENKVGLQTGGSVSFEETDEGLLVTPRRVIATSFLDEIVQALEAKGIILNDLFDAGQIIRQQIYDEKYKAKDTTS